MSNPIVRDQSESGDYAKIYAGEYLLINNVWGKKGITNYHQKIFAKNRGKHLIMGWEWDWPHSPDVLAYPSVIYGQNPWMVSSTTPLLPVKAGDKQVVVSCKIKMLLKGEYNLAIDLWLSRSEHPGENEIVHEIMIWLSSSGFNPSGTMVDQVTIAGKKYALWNNKNQGTGWDYIVFVSQDDQLRARLNMNDFLQFLYERKMVKEGLYLSSVELGNEISGGTGLTEIEEFTVQVIK